MIKDIDNEQILSEVHQLENHKMENQLFELANMEIKVPYATYQKLLKDLPNKIALLSQELDANQMNDLMEYFLTIISYSFPKEIQTKKFILSVLNQVKTIQSNEVLLKFFIFISRYYDDEVYVPPKELLEFCFRILISIQFPIQFYQEKIIFNLLTFFCTAYIYYKSMINDIKLYQLLFQFLSSSPAFNYPITYLLCSLITECKSDEVLSFYLTIIQLIYSSVLPLAMQSIETDSNALSILMNITSIISGFASRNIELNKYFINSCAENIFLQILDLWTISKDIDYNILDSFEIICKLFKMQQPGSELESQYLNILQAYYNKGVTEAVVSSIMSPNDLTATSIKILKLIFEINLKKGTSFICQNQMEFYPFIKNIMRLLNVGNLQQRIMSGRFLAKIARLIPNFMIGFLASDAEIMAKLSLNFDDEDLRNNSDLCFITLLANLLSLNDEKLSRCIIKAFFVIAKRFDDMDKISEFRETCALYDVEDKVKGITENSENISTYEIGNDFILTAFGAYPFNDDVIIPY